MPHNLYSALQMYYLSRFKDSTRQGTIDLMLGNYVSEESFNEAKAPDDEDCTATAEHVKLLIEDCKKMLINDPEVVLGTWGLINADPYTGDPSETEIDSILILTKDSYFVADYDDQVDKVTKYQRVFLKDLTFIESGIPESATSLFKSNKHFYCIRLNYKVDGVSGYYHMFRSTNLRFFNNMAVVIKNEEEEIESLKSICEAFVVAFDVCGLNPVVYKQGLKLDRRKSKVVNYNNGSNIYLDIVGLPQLTRNVSETQLLALKNAGTKALSNMSQKFSKLNKLGATFKPNKKEPKFTIGKPKQETSSDSDDDYENSIFQPNTPVETSLLYGTDSSCSFDKNDLFIERGIELTEQSHLDEPVIESKSDTFLPSVGIVMGTTGDTLDLGKGTLEQRDKMNQENASQMNVVQLSSIMQNVSIQAAPEIQINWEDGAKQIPNSLKLEKKFSHSSGEVDTNEHTEMFDPNSIYIAGESRFEKRSNSEQDVTLNISQSQSESALKSKLTNLASPVTSVTKELVLTPFSKLAKGVQTLGANLDPRKMSISAARNITEREYEEHKKLQEKWRNCKTRLIAL